MGAGAPIGIGAAPGIGAGGAPVIGGGAGAMPIGNGAGAGAPIGSGANPIDKEPDSRIGPAAGIGAATGTGTARGIGAAVGIGAIKGCLYGRELSKLPDRDVVLSVCAIIEQTLSSNCDYIRCTNVSRNLPLNAI